MPGYVGRFAPSPTGPLHFGSLVAALGSFLEARSRDGRWLMRIEDVDTPRTVPGAEAAILSALERLGLWWDGPVVRQSEREAAYRDAIDRLRSSGRVFDCACSRKEIAETAGDASQRYPGTCRNGIPAGRRPRSIRLRVGAGAPVCFDDVLQGRICEDVSEAVGDFVLRRADALIAYQLAVVVDDAAAGITHVVRGADLLDSTCRQIVLQRALGVATPGYLHLPVAANAAGEKLSKQTRARALEPGGEAVQLVTALQFMGQAPPAELRDERPDTIVEWARRHWRVDAIPAMRAMPAPESWGTSG